MSTANQFRFAFTFAGLFILIGVIALGCGVWNLAQSLRGSHWPTTEGVVQTAKMERHSSNKGGDTYSAAISYNYQVAGTNYTSTRMAFGEMSSSTAYAQGILNRFPVGKKVPVYYSPGDPQLAVLETGIHGGTWICFGVGTIFVLVGWMMLAIFSMAFHAEQPAKPVQTMETKGGLQIQFLIGVIFIVMGSSVFFGEPATGVPAWIGYAGGGMFVLVGLSMLAYHLQNKFYSKILLWAAALAFLVVFHWVSFGPGERIGTATDPFSQHAGVSVKTYFAVATILMDLILLVCLVKWLKKARKD